MIEEYIVKTIIIGCSSVGKTSLVHYFINNEFGGNLLQTTGVEYSSKSIIYNDKEVKLQLWDTAGQERFKSITKTYYRGAKGAVLVFDLTSKYSFTQAKEWFKLAKEVCGESFGCVLVGNKKDLEDNREIGFEEISIFAEENDLLYIETSCVTGENIEKVFETMLDVIFSKINAEIIKIDDLRRKWMQEPILNNNIEKKNKCGC